MRCVYELSGCSEMVFLSGCEQGRVLKTADRTGAVFQRIIFILRNYLIDIFLTINSAPD